MSLQQLASHANSEELHFEFEFRKTNYVVHSYENAGDMPPGKYIIQLYYENRKLAEKEFLVVESP